MNKGGRGVASPLDRLSPAPVSGDAVAVAAARAPRPDRTKQPRARYRA